MALKSISGVTCYVKDLEKTVKFYQALGLRLGKQDDRSATLYVNWFWVTFLAQDKEDKSEFQKEARLTDKGAGLYLNIKVDDVDEFYSHVLDKGLQPSSEPRDWPWGNREFALRDPDGYKLVFFEKK